MATRLIEPFMTYNDDNGVPLAGGLLHFYVSEPVSDPKDTFSDDTLLVENTNPIVLDAAGRAGVDVWGDGEYKMVVADSGDVTIQTFDPVSGSMSITKLDNIADLTALVKSTLTDGDEFIVSGYSVQGDSAGGTLYWDSSSTDTANAITIFEADEGGTGRWLKIKDGAWRSVEAGIDLTGATAASDQLNAFYALGGDLVMTLGTYLLDKQVDIPFGANIKYENGVIMDASAATTAGNFADETVIKAGVNTLTALPALNANVTKNDDSVVFASAPSIAEGDIITFADPTDGSFNGVRVYYRAGEFAQVTNISGSTVGLTAGLYAGYVAATIDMYLLDGGQINISGSHTILPPTGVGMEAIRGFYGLGLIHSRIDDMIVDNGNNACMELRHCYDVRGSNLNMSQYRDAGFTGDYGIVFSHCQNMRIDGTFSSRRHGSTMTGADITASIPNRNIIVSGTVETVEDNGIRAADMHGNTEYCGYEGLIKGGTSFGGNHNWANAAIISDAEGICISHSEMLGWDFKYDGCRCIAYGDAEVDGTLRGVFDLGGNGTSAGTDTTEGGTISLRGVTIEAPDMTGNVIKIRNRGSAPSNPISIDVSGVKIKAASAALDLFIGNPSGDDFDVLNGDGFVSFDNLGYSVSNVTAIRGWKTTGSFIMNGNTGVAVVTDAVVFGKKFPKAPSVNIDIGNPAYGSDIIVSGSDSVTTTGFDAITRTVDLANFDATVDRACTYTAELDE